jgi:YVTN family beta-propeller protein
MLSLRIPSLAVVAVVAVVACAASLHPAAAQGVRSTATAPFPNFESGPVRPLLLTPDGQTLLVLNTPDHRVEIWDTQVDARGQPHPAWRAAVFTGLEPVSMALHPDDPDTLFVANLLSDSVSVVDVSRRAVRATIAVGDEPQDLVVAEGRLYVATARSAQAPDLVQPGTFVDNAVVVAQADAPYAVLDRVELPAHKPRALAVADGGVHVIPQNSGNRTTVLDAFDAGALGLEQLDTDAFDPPLVYNPVLARPDLATAAWTHSLFGLPGWMIPLTGRIVTDAEFPGLVTPLQDADVLTLDAASGALVPGAVSGVGTTLLAVERNPVTGDLWIANTEARNRIRFEPVISGAAFENRVTVVTPGGAVGAVLPLDAPDTTVSHAQPVALAFHVPGGGVGAADGRGGLAYVATLGDDTVVVLDALTGAVVDELAVGPLPSGLAVDDAHGLLWVYTRGDGRLAVYDIAAGHAQAARTMPLSYDPEPLSVRVGRRHLYDAREASGAGTGNFSCASCHVFGHMDQLAWDLGNPLGATGYVYPDLASGVLGDQGIALGAKKAIQTHPMKGPMTTQSLRGLADASAAPLHWRGDRRFFQDFRGAFVGLLGGSGISPAAMQEYANFVRSLTYPPNPHQPRDRVHAGDAAIGRNLFGANPDVPGKEYNPIIPGNVTCNDCHLATTPEGPDVTGSQPTVNFDGESQLFNSAQLRGGYEKTSSHLTGFGLLHDGSIPDVEAFLAFDPPVGPSAFPALNATDRQRIAAFLQQWDTGLSPLVGVQHTAGPGSSSQDLYDFLDLAELQAAPPASHVDLIARGQVLLGEGPGLSFGLLYEQDPGTRSWMYATDQGGHVTRGAIVSAVAAGLVELTFTCVPPGTGRRLGLDRDEDGLYDGIERQWGTSPDAPDTDRDGYDDALEVSLGADPLVADVLLAADVTAPAVTDAQAREVYVDAATMHLVTDEPATVRVELGVSPGGSELGVVVTDQLVRTHDVVLTGLPGGTEIHWTATASDRNGNAGTAEGSFTTAPPQYHVGEVALVSDGGSPLTLTAQVLVVDQAGAPVADIPVRVFWTGDIGGANDFPAVRTDAEGVATFVVGPYTPAAPDEVTIGVALIGSNQPTDAFYIGDAGSVPPFFYAPSANAVSYRTIAVP